MLLSYPYCSISALWALERMWWVASGGGAKDGDLLEKDLALDKDVEAAAEWVRMGSDLGIRRFGLWSPICYENFSKTLKSLYSFGPQFLHQRNGKNSTCFQSTGFVKKIKT